MSRLRPSRRLAVLTVVVLGVFACAAIAFFTAPGAGAALAGTGTLVAPTIGTATPGPGSVALTWSSVTAPAGGTVTYYVRRDAGAPAGNCPPSSSPTTATSCTDTSIAAGSHSYTVTAVWRSWTATSATTTVTVASAAATHLVLAATTSTPAAGTADNLTITAKDVANNTVTGYTGDKSLTFSGAANAPNGTHPTVSDKTGAAINFGTAETITFTNGVATTASGTNGAMKLYKAESPTISVTDAAISSNGLAVTVAAGAADKLAFPVQPSNTTAGVTISPAVKVEIDDTFGNLTSSTASVVLAASSQTLSGSLTQPATAGVATFNNLSMTRAGSYTLAATSGSLTGVTSTSFTISAAAASKLAFLVQPSNATAGVTISPAVKVEIDDTFGNLTSSTASVVLAASSQTLSGTLTQAAVAGVATFNNLSMTIAGSYTLAATSGSLTGVTSTSFTISAAVASRMLFVNCSQPSNANTTCTGQPISMGNNSNMTFNLRTTDQFGNVSAPIGNVTITFTNSDTAFSMGAGSPATVTGGTTLSNQVTLVHASNGLDTLTAQATGFTAATLTAQK